MAVSLSKGQKISLSKESGGNLTRIMVGAGWDPANASDDIDLDLSCLLISEQREVVDMVYFMQLKSKDGSVRHTGDNLTGEGDGDDEKILVDLSKVPANVKHIVFTVGSYSGQTFGEVANAFCRVVDHSTKRELARYEISTAGSAKGLIISRVYRHNGEWKMAAVGEFHSHGKTVKDFREIAARLC